jgi:hypothetical protein
VNQECLRDVIGHLKPRKSEQPALAA